MAAPEDFKNTLAFYDVLLRQQGITRTDVCKRANLSRNVITNIINAVIKRPDYDTVVAIVQAVNSFGVKPAWDLNKALEEAGWRESVAVATPREIVDIPPYPMATMNLPIYDARKAGKEGITLGSYQGTVNLDSSYIVMQFMVPSHPEVLMLVQTIGDNDEDDLLVVRRVDSPEIGVMTAKAAEESGHILLGRVAGFLFPPTLGESIFNFPPLTEPRQLAIA